jgi:hypothetical protein
MTDELTPEEAKVERERVQKNYDEGKLTPHQFTVLMQQLPAAPAPEPEPEPVVEKPAPAKKKKASKKAKK